MHRRLQHPHMKWDRSRKVLNATLRSLDFDLWQWGALGVSEKGELRESEKEANVCVGKDHPPICGVCQPSVSRLAFLLSC